MQFEYAVGLPLRVFEQLVASLLARLRSLRGKCINATHPPQDRLIEEAAMMAKGIKAIHIIALGAALLMLVVFLALLKKVTMALSLSFIIDAILLVYALKLTLFSSRA